MIFRLFFGFGFLVGYFVVVDGCVFVVIEGSGKGDRFSGRVGLVVGCGVLGCCFVGV